MKKRFTVIGEYWDNEQGYATDVEAKDADEAIDLAQAEVREALAKRVEGEEQEEEEEEQSQNEPLRIWAVLEGAPAVMWLRDAA